ncbi:MAG: hypothetical protein ACXIU8_16205 [Alkalilacustris sp.]
MNLFWLLRMRRWVQHPPSERMVWFVLGVIALCAVLFAIDRIWGWPEALTPATDGRRPFR